MNTLRKGDETLYNGRSAVVVKVKGSKIKVRPHGESSRWVEKTELKELKL